MANKKIGKYEATKIWITTQRCYCKALMETYPDVLKDFDTGKFGEFGYDRQLKERLVDCGYEFQSEDIHRRYMAHVLNLTSNQLNKIIEANEQGVIRRASATIDEITYELLNRSVKEAEKNESNSSS